MYKIVLITIIACGLKWFTIDKNLSIADVIDFQSISNQKAIDLFNELSQLEYIEFDYANNFCEDRAHAMALHLQRKGITTAKVWMFVTGIWDNKYPRVLKVHDPNNINKKNLLTWKYHVAPIVVVQNEEQLDTLVLDPALCKMPVTILDWLEKMNVKKQIKPDDVFWTIRDTKYHIYRTKNKVPKLLEPWVLDKSLYNTHKGLCQGKILQAYLDEYPNDREKRIKARKFKNLPKSYKRQLKPCIETLNELLKEEVKIDGVIK